ncbi:MAG: DUF3854 domain-containing protein [Mycobacterium sp.]|nr:DUF3854 domain-containing protein [Mycobacterium sp.]
MKLIGRCAPLAVMPDERLATTKRPPRREGRRRHRHDAPRFYLRRRHVRALLDCPEARRIEDRRRVPGVPHHRRRLGGQRMSASEILPGHLEMLAASGITPEFAAARGYETITDVARLAELKIVKAAQTLPGLLVPQLRVDGSTWGYQYRPDTPRLSKGKIVKYETPRGQRNGLDVPPGVAPMLADPNVPLWITEGVKKADCGAIHGLCIVALSGVWNWIATSSAGGKMALPEWRDVALNGRRVVMAFDGDIARKESVQIAARALSQYLATKGARIEWLHLPDTDDKTGLDDFLIEHDVGELLALVKPTPPPVSQKPDEPVITEPHKKIEPVEPVAINDALAIFQKWLHLSDTAPVLAVAAAIVANLGEGDPVWLLVVGPPSGGKTEILSSAARLPYIIPAAIITEAALLSGTRKKDCTPNATGGLLRQIKEFGILFAKDFTSVLSQNRDTARAAISAMREIYDGSWDRPVGTDGGKVLHWHGKCGFIGGVTPSYDRYGAIVNALGDRYLLLRMPNVDAEHQAHAALRSSEHEKKMRVELAAAMTGLIVGADKTRVHAELSEADTARLVKLATFTARARTAVERDGYTGELLVIPQPEGPARLVKALRRVYGGALAIGAEIDTAWDLVERMSIDCAPAMRISIVRALLTFTDPQRTSEIARRAGVVTKTAHRVLDDLALLGIAVMTKKSGADNSPDLWVASKWLRDSWPKVGQISTTKREGEIKEGDHHTNNSDSPPIPFGLSLSHSERSDWEEELFKTKNADPPSPPADDVPNDAYRNGKCIKCHTRPYSPGRPRCEDCHREYLSHSVYGVSP